MYYLNSRYYDSNTGRFISPDRLDVLNATPDQLTDKNLFAYCDNNPITREDGDGEFWHILAGAAIGGVISATISIITQKLTKGEIDWGAVAISGATGMATGALSAVGAPVAVTAAFSAFGSAGESVYSDLKDGKDTGKIIANAIISAGTSALFSFMGNSSEVMNNMYFASQKASKQILAGGMSPGLKKEALKTIKKYYKELGRYIISETKDGFIPSIASWGSTEIIKGAFSSIIGW